MIILIVNFFLLRQREVVVFKERDLDIGKTHSVPSSHVVVFETKTPFFFYNKKVTD